MLWSTWSVLLIVAGATPIAEASVGETEVNADARLPPGVGAPSDILGPSRGDPTGGPARSAPVTKQLGDPETPLVPVIAGPPRRYSSEIVIADVLGLTLTGVFLIATGPTVYAFAPWLLASPMVHVMHGRTDKGVVSLLLHFGAPVAAVLLGGLDDLGPGLLAGALAATILDAALLGSR